MSTSANGASDALGMGPSAGYSLIFLITVICAFTVFICMPSLHAVAFVRDIHIHIYAVTNLLMLSFWIKLIIKMPKFLTIQKPNVRQFSVSGFAAALKPNNFDGKNFMIWHAKMVLWLTTMNCCHATQGKPEQFTPEEEQKFLAADNLFRGAVISALHPKYEKNYISCTSYKEL